MDRFYGFFLSSLSPKTGHRQRSNQGESSFPSVQTGFSGTVLALFGVVLQESQQFSGSGRHHRMG
jgi:hypothetical protein